MKRLIIEEYKKLFKKKSVWILTLLTVIVTLGICNKQYFQYEYKDFIGEVYNLEGERIKGLELLKVRDQTLHKYAGVWNKEKEKQLQQNLGDILKQYPQDQLDEKAMEKNYGQSWKGYLEKEKNGTLQKSDVDEIMENVGDVIYHTDDNGNIILDKYYVNDQKRNYYAYAYLGRTQVQQIDKYAFEEWNSLLIPYQINIPDQIGNHQLTLTQKQAYQEKMVKSLTLLPDTFDSPIPNERLLNTLSWVYIFPIFVIMIVLANIFSIESENRTDQIIYPTYMSKHRVTLSKLFVGYSYAILLIWLQFLIVFIFSMIFLSVHEWNMAVVDLGILNQLPIFPTTYLKLLINALFIPTFSGIAIATLTMLLSYFLKRKFIVIIVLFIYMIIGILMTLMFQTNLSSIMTLLKFFHPLQISIYDLYITQSMILMSEFPYLITSHLFIPMKVIVIGGWSIFSLVVIVILSHLSKKQYIWK